MTDSLFHPDRRLLLAGAAGIGLGAAPAFAAHPDVDGKTSWSESVMVVYLSDDLQTGLAYRICRFPDLNDSWVWCHVIADGKMYAYTGQYLGCSPRHNEANTDGVVFDVPGFAARMTRAGTSARFERMSFSFAAGCHAGTDPREGGGRVPVTVEGIFYPGQNHGTLQPGRYERTGRIEATVTVAGREIAIRGVAKQHEQTQTAPRFKESFTYCNLWNADGAFLGLLVGAKGGGDLESGGHARAFKSLAMTKPGVERRIHGMLVDGTPVEISARATTTYSIPVYRRVWLGAMVSAVVNGEKMVGTFNDWKPEDQTYAEA